MDNVIEGENNALTPTPIIQDKPRTMDFPDAMREIMKGNKVARVEWGNTDYCVLKDEWLGIFKDGKYFKYWEISQGDIEGNDWIVVKEVN